MPYTDETTAAVKIGRIISEFLDAPAGDARSEEADLMRRYPLLAGELNEQLAVIRRLRLFARARRRRGAPRG